MKELEVEESAEEPLIPLPRKRNMLRQDDADGPLGTLEPVKCGPAGKRRNKSRKRIAMPGGK